MAEHAVHAPYNFVPFSEKLLIRYESLDQLPRHDRIDPSLKSGEIQVELRAETPVFVSDGQQDPHFFRGPDGTYQIPGSTVRAWCGRTCRSWASAWCVQERIWTTCRSISARLQERNTVSPAR